MNNVNSFSFLSIQVPYFLPATHRVQVTEDTPVGSLVLVLNATDPDLAEAADLVYSIVEPVTAVDADGKPVTSNELDSSAAAGGSFRFSVVIYKEFEKSYPGFF